MGRSFKSEEITNKILRQQEKTLHQLEASVLPIQTNAGVQLPEKNISNIRSQIEFLLKGTKKMVISNKNQRKNSEDPLTILTVISKGFRMVIKSNQTKWDYVLDLNKNSLQLNNNVATDIDANRFKAFFNRFTSRMVEDQYEVIRDE